MPDNKEIQIIATGITTLDEARYFAAMGADWVGFDTLRLTAGEIKSIAEWIVVPKTFIEMQAVKEDVLFEISNKIQLHGVCLPLDSVIPTWYEGNIIRRLQFPTQEDIVNLGRNEIFLFHLNLFPNEQDTFDELQRICMHSTCWIETETRQISLTELCEKLPVNGIVIRCIEEAIMGTDAYAHYDVFFEEMEMIRASG